MSICQYEQNSRLYCITEQSERWDSHKELACSLVRRRLATAQAELTQTNYLIMFIYIYTQSNKLPNVYQHKHQYTIKQII